MAGQFVLGTHAEAKAQIGKLRVHLASVGPVNAAMIRYFAAAVEDGNPGYWDDDFAAAQWGSVISPPAMLVHWVLPAPWSPGRSAGDDLAPPMLMTQVPLPGDSLINISVDYTYHRPVRVGDRLHMVEELIDVSEEKATRLGTGHFLTTEATFLVDDEEVATQSNIAFRYRARSADA